MTRTKCKSMTGMLSLLLAGMILCTMAVPASAGEISTSGGSGSTPVSLTTTNEGLGGGGGNVTPTKLNVSVPTALPIAMADDGDIITANTCRIVNHSYGAVRVRTVSISAARGWHLTAFGSKDSLAHEKVDSNKLGFALSIGGGPLAKTESNHPAQQLIDAPMRGCYMSGSGDPDRNSVRIDYDAIVTPLSGTVDNATIANVIFVIEWDTI